jgi:putative tryptophan/tyrosine transport system substrate-binding protein
MRRREFTKLLFLGMISRPRVAMAQRSGRVPSVAVLTPYEEAGKNVFTPISRGAFDGALKELGWIDGQNIRIEYHDAGGDLDLLRRLAKESVKLHPDVIVAVNTPLVAAVLDVTHTIPVVFGLVSDPIGSGFVQNLARPGGNATGFAYGDPSLASKWLELLKEISPAINRVAVLFNPGAAPGGGAYYLQPFEAAARSFAITPIAAPVRNPGEITQAIASLEGQPPSGLLVTPDYFVASQRELIISLAADHRVAAIYPLPAFTTNGGLM